METRVEHILITLNGVERKVAGEATVLTLLNELALPPTKVAVERNLEVVPKSVYGQERLQPGDRIEIVHFIGGG